MTAPPDPHPPKRPFLTAQWRHLCLVTYAVDPALLTPRLAPGLELDTRDGQAFVSLVAFDFLHTRVLGIRWPWHVNFPEVNLRFYVRRPHPTGPQRGVMFVRELVPRPAISIIAKLVYNEPYATARMSSSVTTTADSIRVEHDWRFAGRRHRLQLDADALPFTPPPDSIEHFFKEHSWGFGISRRGQLLTYRVDHPVWQIFPNPRAIVDVDFTACYGPAWAPLSHATPISIVLAEGSPVKVWPKS